MVTRVLPLEGQFPAGWHRILWKMKWTCLAAKRSALFLYFDCVSEIWIGRTNSVLVICGSSACTGALILVSQIIWNQHKTAPPCWSQLDPDSPLMSYTNPPHTPHGFVASFSRPRLCFGIMTYCFNDITAVFWEVLLQDTRNEVLLPVLTSSSGFTVAFKKTTTDFWCCHYPE